MNEVETQIEDTRWAADDSDIEYDSEASFSDDDDDSEGEVPVVTGDVKEIDPSCRPFVGVGNSHPKIAVWTSKSSTIATPNFKEGTFTRGWKPVIDGKIQVSGEAPALKVRSQPMQASSSAVSSQKHSSSDNASPAPTGTGVSEVKKDGNDSDSDVRRVPEISSKGGASGTSSAQPPGKTSGSRTRKRGGAPADKEHKRLKRLLRNRVSAQQARERKKAYLTDLEVRSKELQQRNEELEERLSTLQRENYMLRQIVKNTALKNNGGGGGAGIEAQRSIDS